MYAGQTNGETVVQVTELRALCRDDARDFIPAFGGQGHAWVPGIAEAGDALEQLPFFERLGKSRERGTHRAGEIDLENVMVSVSAGYSWRVFDFGLTCCVNRTRASSVMMRMGLCMLRRVRTSSCHAYNTHRPAR